MDPITTLRSYGSITALCIIRDPKSPSNDPKKSMDDCNDDHLEQDFGVRPSDNIHSALVQRKKNHNDDDTMAFHNVSTLSKLRSNTASLSLSPAIIASSDVNGNAHLWDLSTRRIIADFGDIQSNHSKRSSPGLAIRRIEGANQFLYHTRGKEGLVSIYDVERCTSNTKLDGFTNKIMKEYDNPNKDNSNVLVSYETGSRTFCAAAPCIGDPNLIVLPSQNETFLTVHDLRSNQTKNNNAAFAYIHGAYGSKRNINLQRSNERIYGMITSLAMISTDSKLIIASGMESGDLFFHHLTGTNANILDRNYITSLQNSSIKLGKDPILSLDLAHSNINQSSKSTKLQQQSNFTSLLSIAGCAGDADEMCALSPKDQGTVNLIKTIIPVPPSLTLQSDPNDASKNNKPILQKMESRLRKRLGTCQIGEYAPGGKPGVSTCRFRNDGKVFAVGGWDRRVRIFSRDGNKALAILKGHEGSVTALDWASNATSNGLLATGSEDGNIKLYSVFPSY